MILLTDEIIGHLREAVELPDPESLQIQERLRPFDPPGANQTYRPGPDGVPRLPNFGEGYRFHVTGLIHGEDGFATSKPAAVEAAVRRLTDKLMRNIADIWQAEATHLADADVVVLAYGGTARSANRAVRMAREKGLKVGLYRPITLWPVHDEAVRQVIAGRKAVVVPELNLGQYAREVERVAHGTTTVVRCNKVSGEILTPAEILSAIEGVYRA